MNSYFDPPKPIVRRRQLEARDFRMWWTILRFAIAAAMITAVAEVSHRLPRLGALLLTLPLVSIIALVMTWTEHRDLVSVSRLSREALVLVPLGLPFFIPLAFADRIGLGFWSAILSGVVLASATIGTWLYLAPSRI
jgi:hypothetical protein